MTTVYFCKHCGRYRTTDGDYVRLNAHERGVLILCSEKLEVKEAICPECDETPHFSRRGTPFIRRGSG